MITSNFKKNKEFLKTHCLSQSMPNIFYILFAPKTTTTEKFRISGLSCPPPNNINEYFTPIWLGLTPTITISYNMDLIHNIMILNI